MAKKSAKDAVITVHGRDISKDVETYEIKKKQNLTDVSGFGENAIVVPGQLSYEVSLDVWYNPTGSVYALETAIGVQTGTTVTIKPVSTDKTFTMLGLVENIDYSGNKDGSAIKLGKVVIKEAEGSITGWA